MKTKKFAGILLLLIHAVFLFPIMETHAEDRSNVRSVRDSLDVFSELKIFESDSQYALKNDVIVAIIDNGVDITHKSLKNNLWINPLEKNETIGLLSNGNDDDRDGYIDDIHGYNFVSRRGDPSHETVIDHGTHVAGLALLNSHVKLMTLNVFGRQLSADVAPIDEAIRYAADHGADVINISISGPEKSDSTAAAIQYALQKGCVVIAAAGNSNLNIDEDFYFPASYAPQFPGLISVGAIDLQTNDLCEFPTSGSNYGSNTVKIAAPGCDHAAPGFGIFSARSNDRFGYKKGTSMAAPIVAGAAAIVLGFLRDHVNVLAPGPKTSSSRPSPVLIEKILLESGAVSASLFGKIQGGKRLDLNSLAKTMERYFSH